MPYNGKGPIKLELGDQSTRSRKNMSQTQKKISGKSRHDLSKDSSRFIGVNKDKNDF